MELPTITEVKRFFTEEQPTLFDRTMKNRKQPIFEFWTQEYIDQLADHIEQSMIKYNVPNKRGSILEVGAGDGALSHHLREKGIPIVATDDLSWEIERQYQITVLDYDKALEIYEPTIVISSWMPLDEDWTLYFRNQKTVKEYIIIGECEGGCVGSPTIWEDHEGFDWNDLNFYQLCRIDFKFGEDISLHSSTFSFQRKGD